MLCAVLCCEAYSKQMCVGVGVRRRRRVTETAPTNPHTHNSPYVAAAAARKPPRSRDEHISTTARGCRALNFFHVWAPKHILHGRVCGAPQTGHVLCVGLCARQAGPDNVLHVDSMAFNMARAVAKILYPIHISTAVRFAQVGERERDSGAQAASAHSIMFTAHAHARRR